MRTWFPSPTEGQLRANKVPVLSLIGELDPNKPGVDRLNGLMPNLKIVVIPKADHMTTFGDPEFIKNLKAILVEHSSTPRAKKQNNSCTRNQTRPLRNDRAHRRGRDG
jgi:pimeloyl-ACP methyl ester carboxylesterase